MNHWLYDPHQKHPYPRSWEGMSKLLRDMDLIRAARDLEEIISQKTAANYPTET